MIGKKQILFAGIFALLVIGFLGIASASVDGIKISITKDLPNPVSPGNSYDVKVNVSNNNGTDVKIIWLNTSSSSGTVWTKLPSVSVLKDNSSAEYSATLKIPSDFSGTTSRILKAEVYDNTTNALLGTIQENFKVNYTKKSKAFEFCEYGENGTLEIKKLDITNLGEGSDNEWEPLDEIEIGVDIRNKNRTDSVDDVVVEIEIHNNKGEDVTDDFDLEDDSIELGRIHKKDTETAVFKIKELPADLEEGNYKIYIKAYSDGDEDLECVSSSDDFSKRDYHEIEIKKEWSEAVIVKKSTLENKISASCGDEKVRVPVYIYNLGDDKERKVLVNLYSKELGIDEYQVVDGLSSGKGKELEFFIDIPEELDKDSYNLNIITYFDYDKRKDEMSEFSYDKNSKEDLEEDYKIKLEILSCSMPEPTIQATLDSDAIVGEDMIIKMTITNNGKKGKFTISASDFEAWADLVEISPSEVELDKGESKDIILTMIPKKAGTNSFNVKVVSSDGKIHEREVSATILEKQNGQFSLKNLSDKVLYTIAIILILLVLILFVAVVRLARRRA